MSGSNKTIIPSITSSIGKESTVCQQMAPVYKRPDAPVTHAMPPQRPPSPTFRQKIARLDMSTLNFCGSKLPRKIIQSKADIQTFLESEGLARLMDLLMSVNRSIIGLKLISSNSSVKEAEDVSNAVKSIIELIDNLDKMATDKFPPIENDGQQRFGNIAFRHWCTEFEVEAANLLRQCLPERFHPAIGELVVYFKESFGNGTRIDYGSGHELNFVIFLTCLDLIGYFTDEDFKAIGLLIFPRYLDFVRKLQITYRLEPAGSHGVWGLDDYQFIAYIWGSAQLIGHQHMKPKSFLNDEIVNSYAKDYLFLSCIRFVKKMKSGPFHEHSPMLYDVSAVPNWTKVNMGLVKMFIGEVLEKVPIVQHISFGVLIPWQPSI